MADCLAVLHLLSRPLFSQEAFSLVVFTPCFDVFSAQLDPTFSQLDSPCSTNLCFSDKFSTSFSSLDAMCGILFLLGSRGAEIEFPEFFSVSSCFSVNTKKEKEDLCRVLN